MPLSDGAGLALPGCGGGAIRGSSAITRTDIPAANGIAHAVNRAILP